MSVIVYFSEIYKLFKYLLWNLKPFEFFILPNILIFFLVLSSIFIFPIAWNRVVECIDEDVLVYLILLHIDFASLIILEINNTLLKLGVVNTKNSNIINHENPELLIGTWELDCDMPSQAEFADFLPNNSWLLSPVYILELMMLNSLPRCSMFFVLINLFLTISYLF